MSQYFRWPVIGGGAGGTVTSVAVTVPSILSVSGSPITTSGTIAITLATETANTVFAGPTSGGAATPTFRSLVADDIPSLTTLYFKLDQATPQTVTEGATMPTFQAGDADADVGLNFTTPSWDTWRLYVGGGNNPSNFRDLVFHNITNSVKTLVLHRDGTSEFTGDVTVPTEIYGAGWNGSNEVPTKDAVYDKIQSLPVPINTDTFGVTADNGADVLPVGVLGYKTMPYACTITGWGITSDASGSVVFDIWKAASAIPTVADTITASAKPTLSSQQLNTSTTLTGWTVNVAAGDVIGFNIDSASTVKSATLVITVTLV